MSESTLAETKDREPNGYLTTGIIYKIDSDNDIKILVITRSDTKLEEPGKDALISGFGASIDYPNSPLEAVKHEVGRSLVAKNKRGTDWVEYDCLKKPIAENLTNKDGKPIKNFIFVGTVDEKTITRSHRWISLENDLEINSLAFEHPKIVKEFRNMVRDQEIKLIP